MTDEIGLLGMLDRMQREGSIVSYKLEKSADERSVVVKLVPRAWVAHIDLAVGFVVDPAAGLVVDRKCRSCGSYVREDTLTIDLVCRACVKREAEAEEPEL